MKLKNKNNKFKINLNLLKNKINQKNLTIFLISFSLVSIIIGIIFYIYLNTNDKDLIKSNINSYFIISSYDYLSSFKDIFQETIFNIIKIWIIGISIIGIIVIIFLFFIESFSTGFTISSIIDTYKFKGIIGSICYLFPSRITYLLLFFILSIFSIRISYQIIKLLFFKREVDINNEMKKYFKVLIFSLIFGLFYSILEVFVSPFMIKIFNMIEG